MRVKDTILRNLRKLSELEKIRKDVEVVYHTEPDNKGFIKAVVTARENEQAMLFLITKQISRYLHMNEKEVKDMLMTDKQKVVAMLQAEKQKCNFVANTIR